MGVQVLQLEDDRLLKEQALFVICEAPFRLELDAIELTHVVALYIDLHR